MEKKKGKVYLVGAGPGDPGLMTVKGMELLSRADVLVYDYLANARFLEGARPGAELIYAGKRGGCHTMTQKEISSLVVKKAREGLEVVRLKGGDPFIFGRGGEEAQELFAAGVDFDVIPGVTSASAVPAYAGIPLTHRDYTSTVALVTGHEDPNKDRSEIRWDKLATGAGTLVFLMGVGNLAGIAERLTAHGRSPETPVAVIRRGTVPEQRTVTGSLANIARLVEEQGIKPPAIIVVGEVVRLRRELNWFENKPLFGRRIIVTRARQQSSEFLGTLAGLGAQCIEFLVIEAVAPESWEPLDRAVLSLENYHWLVFTSVNGVKYFLDRLEVAGKDVRDLKGLRIAAIGPKTAGLWVRMGIRPDLVPEEYRAEAVAEGFRAVGARGIRVLIPRAETAREVLPDELRKMGADVDVVPAYRTVKPDTRSDEVMSLMKDGAVDMVTFTSSSTVRNFIEMFGFNVKERESLQAWMEKVAVACIGPITARTAREEGFSVSLTPGEYTVAALTEAIVAYYRSGSARSAE